MSFKTWFLGLTGNEQVAFFGIIGCSVGAVFTALGAEGLGYPFTGLGVGFLFGGFIGILFLGNSDS